MGSILKNIYTNKISPRLYPGSMLPVKTTTTGHYVLNPRVRIFHNARAEAIMIISEIICSTNYFIIEKYLLWFK